MNTWTRLACVAAVACAAPSAGAQTWPAKPVRLVVTYPPGGGSDIIARTLAQKLTEPLGVQVVVENRPGANGNIGTDYVAKSAPDGYTLVLGNTGPLCISPAIYSTIPYNTARDFSPISLVASTPIILVVHPSFPVRTVGDLVKIAKARPGQLRFASSGNGATSHLAGEMLKLMAGIDMVHVPYKGVAPAIVDVIAGQIEMQFLDVSVVVGYIKNGKVRAVAWAGPRRGPAFPEVPTVAESGFPGFDVTGWYGILGAAGMPKDVVARLNGAIVKALAQPDTRERFDAIGALPVTSTPDEFAEYIRAELAKWAKVARAANLKVE